MSGMWWFIIGVVIGGLSLWIYMRERELRLQAEIDATQHKKVAEDLKAPAVKTRAIGKGSPPRSKRKPKPAETDDRSAGEEAENEEEDAPSDETEQDDAHAGEEDEPAEEDEDEPAEEDDEESGEETPKQKPKVSLKIPEPSSVSEVQDDSEE